MNNSVNKDESIYMTSTNTKLLDKKTLDKNIDHIFNKTSTDSFLRHNSPNIPNQNLDKEKEKENNLTGKNIPSFENKNKDSFNTQEQKNKTQNRPKSKVKKVDYIGRDEKVSSDVYFKVKDENEMLKKQQYTLNDDIKRLNVALEKVKYDVLVERRMSDRKVIKVDNEFTLEAENVKIENDKLKEQLRKMKTILEGLKSDTKKKSFGPKKNLANAEKAYISQSEKNDFLKCINLLRDQLKTSESEVKRLHSELYGPNSKVRNIGDYAKEV
jgi:hypothetical protein